jgi:cell division septation protein DedD
VIILPGLLDGQKKHYQDEFAAIPLVPKPGDRDEPDMLPAATQALPAQPPEGAAEEVRAGDAAAPSLDPSRLAATATAISILCRSSSLNLLKNRSRLRSRSRNRSVIKRQNSSPQRQKRLRQQKTQQDAAAKRLRGAARCAEKRR